MGDKVPVGRMDSWATPTVRTLTADGDTGVIVAACTGNSDRRLLLHQPWNAGVIAHYAGLNG